MRTALVAGVAAWMILGAPAQAQMVSVALNADIRSTNPGVNRDDNTDGVVLHMIEGLVAYRENGGVAPLLAERYDIAPDGKTYTFRLRDGVRFHNGAAMTSAEALWSWRRYLDPKTDWRCLPDLDGRNGLKIEAVEAPDQRTIVMRINQPSALFLDTLSRTDCGMGGILHPDSVGPDGAWKQPVGTGPYMMGPWQRGQHVTLNRFEGYVSPPGDTPDGYVGRKRPLAASVRFVVIPDAAAGRAAVLSGAIDVAELQDTDVAEMRKNPAVEVVTAPTANKHTFLLQTRDPLIGNVHLRQAIAAALDLPEIVASVSSGLGTPNGSAVFAGSPFYDDVQRAGYGRDLERVKQLLKQANYKGEVIRILCNRRTSVPSYPAALIAQAQLQEAGINAELEVLEWATQLDRYNRGNYQMQSFTFSARVDPAQSYEQFMGPKDRQPRKIWDDPEAQAMLERASITSDEAERRRLFQDLHRRQLAQTPLIFLYNGVEANAMSRRVRGFRSWALAKPRLWEVEVVR
ncbi:MAG: ABC transporter substrate-binding protein [Chthoniobacterales bacterium]|nr:ABC transporter substrate-binding protein [Chthoniobacterales bacterium]